MRALSFSYCSLLQDQRAFTCIFVVTVFLIASLDLCRLLKINLVHFRSRQFCRFASLYPETGLSLLWRVASVTSIMEFSLRPIFFLLILCVCAASAQDEYEDEEIGNTSYDDIEESKKIYDMQHPPLSKKRPLKMACAPNRKSVQRKPLLTPKCEGKNVWHIVLQRCVPI